MRVYSLLFIGAMLFMIALQRSEVRADTLVYKESCGYEGFDRWNMNCKVAWDTLSEQLLSKTKLITFCAYFSNRGTFIAPATIVHNGEDGRQFKATDMFDTVKFQGDLLSNRIAWVGTGSRRGPGWSMRGEFKILTDNPKGRTATYAETLWQGHRQLGEIRASCSSMPDEQ
ncbi:hypothetical protein [Bradyrhizobium sp. SZCCHNR1075]|uniref:hypothetical protein n=1 Tax=Bradyrhizobium sp. SZCCHNR1075 TaxID=3057362 RepID=UPI0028F0E9BE|nr:hypothetical protein [Bradyrhizobium sp. SZCCHNR1075]